MDPWVLQTLGLKTSTPLMTPHQLTTSLSSHARQTTSTFPSFWMRQLNIPNVPGEDLPIDYGGDRTTPLQDTASHSEDFHFLSQLSNPPEGLQTLPYYTSDVSPNKTEMAFSTSLSPHCNVKTHSFHQGQAFVRRDEEEAGSLPGSLSSLSDPSSITKDCHELCLQDPSCMNLTMWKTQAIAQTVSCHFKCHSQLPSKSAGNGFQNP